MGCITYNIPTGLVTEYIDRQVIVRSHDPVEIVRQLTTAAHGNVQFVQLLSPDVTPDALDLFANWECGVPLDIVVREPEDYSSLYNFAKLAGTRLIRVTVSVKPGFTKAVKLAMALHFAVKLDVGQPNETMIEELTEICDIYLHRPNVSQPVDYFHSVFLAYYRKEETNLWAIQEDDPDHFRFIDDDGVEHLSARFAGLDLESIDRVRSGGTERGSLAKSECDGCEFSAFCGGYFKWPDATYNCHGVKSIFRTLKTAAAELTETLGGSAFAQEGGA